MAGNLVEFVDFTVGRRKRARRQQARKVRTGTHRHHTDFLGIEATLLGLATYQPDGALGVFPGALIESEIFRTGSAVDEIYAQHSFLLQRFGP